MDVNAETLHPDLLSPYHSRDSMGRKRAEAKRERTKERKKGREEGNEGEEKRRDDIKADPQSAKISPKGRKTSREIKRERVCVCTMCEITQSGREPGRRTNLHIRL